MFLEIVTDLSNLIVNVWAQGEITECGDDL